MKQLGNRCLTISDGTKWLDDIGGSICYDSDVDMWRIMCGIGEYKAGCHVIQSFEGNTPCIPD